MKKLPDSELEIMQAVWAIKHPALRSEIETTLDHQYAKTTILTLLTRLSEKGFIHIEKQGRNSIYYATISKEDYLKTQSRTIFQQLFQGNISAFASALTQSIPKKDLEELKQLLGDNHG